MKLDSLNRLKWITGLAVLLSLSIFSTPAAASWRLPLCESTPEVPGQIPQSLLQAVEDDFKQARFLILDQLIRQGISEIAGIAIEDLKTEIAKAKISARNWTSVESPYDTSGTTNTEAVRASAIWQIHQADDYAVLISAKMWICGGGAANLSRFLMIKRWHHIKPTLALHESLGSVGIHDEDYNCSIGLGVLSSLNATPDGPLDQGELKDLKNFVDHVCNPEELARAPSNDAAEVLMAMPGKKYQSTRQRTLTTEDKVTSARNLAKLRQSRIRLLEQNTKELEKANAAGSTGVGGGGDWRAIDAKYDSINACLTRLGQDHNLENRSYLLHNLYEALESAVEYLYFPGLSSAADLGW